ncbi:MAG: OprO/OprP family phosphate-selective porin [Prevotellaceae bacterium]|jgi:phosphate-selective porin|nr:OprO/OprP family phosphate-selective porin [Prevotellaceae bacterium]
MKHLLLAATVLSLPLNLFSQETPPFQDKLKVSGYIQMQYQHGEKDAMLKVGSGNEHADEAFGRLGVRRGRLKFVYEQHIASAVFQLDITEKGVGFRDAYLNLKDPWLKSSVLRAGVFDRPFGNEISYSSSRRESPERSTITQTLFPNERDLGIMLHLQADKKSPWSFLVLQAGLFSGNAINRDTDSRKDFIGRLFGTKKLDHIELGGGLSYYNGGVYQGTEKVYFMEGKNFVLDDNPDNKGKFAKREYVGADAQFSISTAIGKTALRAEYLFGQQPGLQESSASPNSSTLPAGDTYLRNFKGGYVILAQKIGVSPFSAVVKYDIVDPNTEVSGNEAGGNGTSKTDLKQTTLGFGGLWDANANLRLTAFYEINNYEKNNLPAANDLKRNVFTLRLQYKF